jgi:hypothetical protein
VGDFHSSSGEVPFENQPDFYSQSKLGYHSVLLFFTVHPGSREAISNFLLG